MRILARVIPVLHLVQRFYVGGAERQFIERLRAHPQGFTPVVGCLEILDSARCAGGSSSWPSARRPA